MFSKVLIYELYLPINIYVYDTIMSVYVIGVGTKCIEGGRMGKTLLRHH